MAILSGGRAVQILGKIHDPCIEARQNICGGFLRPYHNSPEHELSGTWKIVQIRTGVARTSSPRRIHGGRSATTGAARNICEQAFVSEAYLVGNCDSLQKGSRDAGLQRQRSAAVPCRRNMRDAQVVKSHISPRSCGVRENSTRRSAAPDPRHPLLSVMRDSACQRRPLCCRKVCGSSVLMSLTQSESRAHVRTTYRLPAGMIIASRGL